MKNYLLPLNKDIDIRNLNASEYEEFNGKKDDAMSELADIRLEIKKIQKVIYAAKNHRLLIVLQGMDTAGKDGTIRNVFEGVDINGIRVEHFDKPTDEELSYDYLWRIHKKVPGDGDIVLFNRSHYEDILVVRVQNLKPKSVWSKRYRHINDFERLLTDEGTKIIKLFLHIDKSEQTKRLQRRIDTPEKHWKIHPNDFKDRDKWGDFVDAYNDALTKTNTEYAQWHWIPSNKKWYRNLIAGRVILNELKSLNAEFPPEKPEIMGMQLK